MFDTKVDIYSREEVNEVLPQIDGAPVVGKLDDDLITVYCHLVSREQDFEDMCTDFRKRFIEQVAKQMLEFSATDGTEVHNSMSQLLGENVISREEAKRFMEVQSDFAQLFHRFWHEARTSLNNWHDFLEVRKDFQVAVIGKKF